MLEKKCCQIKSSGVIVVTKSPVFGDCASAEDKMMLVFVRLIGRWSLRPLGPRIWERWLYFTWALGVEISCS